MSAPPRRLSGVVLAVMLTTGCSANAGDPVEVIEQYEGHPVEAEVVVAQIFDPGAEGSSEEKLRIAWLTDATLAITTWWSSACPKVPSRLVPDADGVVLIIEPEPADGCTDDLAPTTTVISPPEDWTSEGGFEAVTNGESWEVRHEAA